MHGGLQKFTTSTAKFKRRLVCSTHTHLRISTGRLLLCMHQMAIKAEDFLRRSFSHCRLGTLPSFCQNVRAHTSLHGGRPHCTFPNNDFQVQSMQYSILLDMCDHQSQWTGCLEHTTPLHVWMLHPHVWRNNAMPPTEYNAHACYFLEQCHRILKISGRQTQLELSAGWQLMKKRKN